MGIELKRKRVSSFQFEEPKKREEFSQIEINEEVTANIVYMEAEGLYRATMIVYLKGSFEKLEDDFNILLKTTYEYDSDEELTKEKLTPCALKSVNLSRETLCEITRAMFPQPLELPLLEELK